MEFMGVLYSVGLVLFMFMLRKGESMCAPTDVIFIDGCQSGGIIDRQSRRFLSWNRLENALHSTGIVLPPENVKERHDRTFRLSESRYQTYKNTVPGISRPNTARYLKLHSGNIIDTETNTVIDREALLQLMK